MKGASDRVRAAEAPTRASTSWGFSMSTEMTVATRWTSLLKPFGQSGRIGRSSTRAVIMACSLGRPSRLMNPPGNFPAAYIPSSTSTVRGKKSTSRRDVDFFPLTVDVEEGMYAAGKFPGGFIKREGRPSEHAIITARVMDRPIRPLWPKGFNKEVHLVATVISVDMENPHDVLALVGASAALTLSEAPFMGPVGGVRVGRVDGSWVINPTYAEIEQSDINLIVAGTADAITMVEAGAHEVDEDEVILSLIHISEPTRLGMI